MKRLKNKFGELLFCLAEIALGVLLLIDPVGFTSLILTGIGVILAIVGIFNIFRYFSTPAHEAAMEQLLAKGLITLAAGAFAIFGNSLIVGLIDIIIKIYGVILLVAGINKIQFVADSLRFKQKRWYLGIISAVISLGFAAVILLNPFSGDIIWIFTGIALIVDAVIDAVSIVAVTDKPRRRAEEDEE